MPRSFNLLGNQEIIKLIFYKSMQKNHEMKHPKMFSASCRRLSVISMLIWMMLTSPLLFGQQSGKLISLKLDKVTLLDAMKEINRLSGNSVSYKREELEKANKQVSLNLENVQVIKAVETALQGTRLVAIAQGEVILIVPRKDNVESVQKSVRVKGFVYDTQKQPLPGVTVKVVGIPLGTSTNTKGWFAIELPMKSGKLEFSFVGYKKKQIDFTEKTDTLKIVLEEDLQQVEEVVVTGIFNKPKESFTGAVSVVTKEDLKVNYSRNVLQTLANIDPSFRIIQNNEAGSNPNVMPEIQLRGASTMLDLTDLQNQKSRPEYNQPLFIMDGFEVELERVMDMNENEIESITILKDASATSLYGARGANGVVVITTTRLNAGALTVRYEGRVNIQLPDLGTYDNLMTAKEKFEMEKVYGVWDNLNSYLPNGQSVQDAYDEIENAIADGINYDWLKVPTRTGVGQTHILSFMGSQEAWRYSLDLSYQDTKGVMKESDRKNFNGTISLGYRKNKWNISQGLSIGINNNQDSPYGEFSSYAAMNRYWKPYDEDGKPIDYFYHPKSTYGGIDNPVYDKEVGVWNKSKYFNVRSSTQVRFDIMEGFSSMLSLGLTRKSTRMDTYYPPNHKNFASITEVEQKGSFARGDQDMSDWQLSLRLDYAKVFNDKHMVTLGANGELSESVSESVHWTAKGFIASNVSHPGMSMGYPTTGGASGDKSKSRRASLSVAANYYYDQRYFVDASFTYNGGSSFGANSRFSPYYSFGTGWLISNESFMKDNLPFISHFRLRYSVGISGNMFVEPSVSMEVFNRNSSYTYLGGLCWTLSSFANPDLKQQNTLQHNVGGELKLFGERISFDFNYYNKLTNNTLTDMYLAISHGFDAIKGNIGKIRNEGLEWGVSCNLYRNEAKKLNWYVNARFSNNRNTVVKLSEGFKTLIASHQRSMSTAADLVKYQEGKSLDAIYGLRTVGVDPTSGQRIFLKKDGVTTTLEQTADDLVYLGNRQPKLNGNISTSFAWSGLRITVGFGVKWGGKQINMTELNKGENIFISSNLDRRLLKYGWSKPGDQARYKSQYGDFSDISTFTCDAFVHKDNVFSCNNINIDYSFPQKWLKRIGVESIAVSTSLSDIFYFSTIKRERGTDYPFSRNPNFSISCTF